MWKLLTLGGSFQVVAGKYFSMLQGILLTVSTRHVHVSLRSKDGRNIFAVNDSELKKGRQGAEYDDTKFMSKEGEYFLAGVLDGLTDGEQGLLSKHQRLIPSASGPDGRYLVSSIRFLRFSERPIARTDHQWLQAACRRRGASLSSFVLALP
jgi:hypothetical protein